MKQKIFIVMLLVIFLLAACGNATEKSNAKPDHVPSTQNTTSDAVNNNATDTDNNTNESESEVANNTEQTDQEATSGDSKDKESQVSTDRAISEGMKEAYLKKLNKMEESDRHSDVGTTMLELEEQETERFKKWDEELNKIYGELLEQLSTEQIEQLREEQREWIIQRDETATKSAQKYQGGSYESLEYVATQASLTRERCYALVAKYMK